jgi:hypothetical protein
MKLKYPLLLGAVHFAIITIYLTLGFSRNFFLNILLLILLLNISSFLVAVQSFKKGFQFILAFSAFSLISLTIFAIIFTLIASFLKSSEVGYLQEKINKFYVFAIEAEKSYNNIPGFIKIIFSYLIFTLLPSFIVLSLNSKKNRKKVTKRHRQKK